MFNCLSHDIVAHETTHALLDGLHPRYKVPSGLDMLAFHEAFADVVALFQHFTIPTVLNAAVREARGDMNLSERLAGLAVQFGDAIGAHGALRSAIARPPMADEYKTTTEPHARGALLVAAVFAAFRRVYERKTRDLVRLATGGTGILADRRHPQRSRQSPRQGGGVGRRLDPDHLHPRPGLLPADRPDVRRVPEGADHRRPRARPR